MGFLSKCHTCGYEWIAGQDGNHSCTKKMAETISTLTAQLEIAQRSPMQPIYNDKFKANKVIVYLLDNPTATTEDVESMPFSNEDKMQFSQLIGMAVGEYTHKPYVSGGIGEYRAHFARRISNEED